MAVDRRSVTEIAYLAGGPWRATQAGVAMLHARGVVVADRPRQVRRTGSVPADAGTVERMLFATLYEWMAPRELANKPRVRRAMAEVRKELVRSGLVRPGWRRLVMPIVLIAAPPILMARWLDLDAGAVPIALIGCVAAAAVSVSHVLRPTFAGMRLLHRLRRQHARAVTPRQTAGQSDAPRRSNRADADVAATDAYPDADVGVDEVGMVVALFGAAGLLATVPRFAGRSGLLGRGRWSAFLGAGTLHSLSHPEDHAGEWERPSSSSTWSAGSGGDGP